MAKFLLVFLSGAAGLLGAELALQVSGVWPAVSWDWQLREHARVPSASSILTLPRFLNEQYYRTDPDDRVIVALGDSFTEGYPVGPDAAWPKLLENRLDGPESPTRVINMGMGNSGPQQQVRILEDEILTRLVPDDVIWALYANDLYDDRVQNTFRVQDGVLVPLDGSNHWIYRRLALWKSIPLPNTLRIRSAIIRVLMSRWEQFSRPRTTGDPASDERNLELLLQRVADRATRDGFRLWIVLIRPEAAYLHDANPEQWTDDWIFSEYSRLREILDKNGKLSEIDFSQIHENPTAFFVDSTRDGASPGDHHFNEEGQVQMTGTLTELLG